jgi:DNA polymerase-1
MELKELRKAKGTYLDGKDGHGGLARFIESDNRIRSTYRPGGAETTRLSSADPNMQNQPANVEIPELGTKDAFCRTFTSPEGFGLMTADWSQAEVWGLAYTAGDDGLLKVLTSGQDVHAYIGRAIWPVDPEMTDFEWKEAHPELRRKAKVLVFGIGYGLTDDGIADRLNCSPEDAQEIRARYMRVVASLPVYFSQARRDVIELGHRDNIFGQRRHFPAASLLKAMRRFNDLEALIREGINYPIQSGCSTLHSAAHNLTENAPALKKRQCYPVISVHDSITFEFYWPDHAYAEETARIIKHLWEQTALTLILPDGSRLGWSIPVEVSWGKTWGDPIYKLTARGDILDLRKEEGEDQ